MAFDKHLVSCGIETAEGIESVFFFISLVLNAPHITSAVFLAAIGTPG